MTSSTRATLLVGVAAAACVAVYGSETRVKLLQPVALAQAAATAAVLDSLGVEVQRQGVVLHHFRGFSFEVHPNCTGWVHLTLFSAGVALLPAARLRRLLTIGAGTVVLAGANLVRLVGLFAVGVTAPARFEAAHRLLGEGFLAACVLLLWWHFASTTWRSNT